MRRRMLFVGILLIAAGMIVVAAGTGASSDRGVALGWLISLPLVVSIGGCAIAFVSLVRGWNGGASRFPERRIVALVAITGLAFGLAFPLAGIVSQIPDSANGSNDEFVPGAAPVVGVMTFAGVGLTAGLVIGVLASLLARFASRRSRRLDGPARP